MKILLTNDDGYQAPGIAALYEQFRHNHDAIVVAPDRERSAVGHGITLNEPLRMKKFNLNGTYKGYAVSGTPADCVKLALSELYETPPDIIISGINPGSNTGVNIHYSGTVGAAREASFNGVPSVAVSIKRGDIIDYPGMAKFIDNLAQKELLQELPAGTFLNINAPAIELKHIKGVKITRQAGNNVSKKFKKAMDPRKEPYYWYGSMDPVSQEPETDNAALSENYISITPIQCDITNHKLVTELQTLTENHVQPKPR